jgi:putative serine protease PepD
VLVAALVVGGCTSGSASSSATSTASATSGGGSGNATVSACAVTPVANEVIPSVVTIAAHGPNGSGTGSGEVIRSDGYILTNNHVISIAAVSGGSVEVQFSDGQAESATITGRDPQTDLAVLKVQTSRQLKVIALGSSSSVQVGGSIGLGFAIPVDLAKSIADEIIATGRVTHAFFGVQTTPIPPAAAAQAGVPEGLFVQAVSPGGPAATAGLRPNDVITTINGEPATSNIQLEELTLTKKPGDTVSIGYDRAGQSAKATVTLAAQP